MKNFMIAAGVFNDPDSPLYYIVAIAFLALIFVLLWIYLIISKKRGAKGAEEHDDNDPSEPDDKDQTTDDGSDAQEQNCDVQDRTPEEQPDSPEPVEEQAPPAEPDGQTDDASDIAEEHAEPEPETKPIAVPIPEPEPEPAPEPEPETKPETKPQAEKKPAKKQPAKRSGAKAAAFIDTVIDTPELHALYNEIKNAVLAYTGIKAKLSKTEEAFMLGDDKKAAVAAGKEGLYLYLALGPDAVPAKFRAECTDDPVLKTRLCVTSANIDEMRSLIVFAMNVAMLPRSDRKRYVNYVQNAKDARERAKKK